MARRRRPIVVLFGLAVTVLFVWYFAVTVRWAEMWTQLRQARYLFLAPAVFFGLLVYVIKMVRWRMILGPMQRPPYRHLFSSIMIGFMGNCVLPARMGEVLRAVVLRLKVKEIGVSAGIATIVVERVFDLFAIVFYMFLAFAWLGRYGAQATDEQSVVHFSLIRAAGIFWGIVAGVMLLGIIALRLWPGFCRRMAHALLGLTCRGLAGSIGAALLVVRLFSAAGHKALRERCGLTFAGGTQRLDAMLNRFIEGLSVIRSFGQGLAILSMSLVHWTACIALYYFESLCYPELRLGWGGATLVFVFTAFAVAIPQAPSFIGVFQLAVLAATDLAVGVPHGGYAIVSWAICIVPVVAVGLVCLWCEGLTLRRLRREAEQMPDD